VGTKLAPLVIKEFNSIAGVTKDLQELQDLVEEISSWLQTVGDKSMRNGQSSNWLKNLKDAAYDAEDLVNQFYMEAEKHQINVAGINNAVIKYMWTKPKSVVFEWKTAHKIKAIKKRLDAIVKERYDYNTIVNSMQADHPVLRVNQSIGEVPLWTNLDEATIFGRDKMKKQIIYELKTSDQQKVKIVSVTGLGGSGKTALAKLVFNDSNTIKKQFEVVLWIHVSREFVVEKLVEKLFEAIPGEKPNQLPLQHMSRIITDKLAGKRFLLVLDDVWTEDRIHWEQFMVHLSSGAPGSSILLTTRSRKVAEAVDSTYACELPFLSNKDSWKVFKQSFGMSMRRLDPEFVQVGTEIVTKCGGVPLAIKVLAGVLHRMKGIKEWQSIRDSNLLDVDDEERRVFACLWLSYFHLPHHLKHCFTHCAIFPKGHVINRHHLISQWVVNGFVNTTNQVQQPEEVAIGYFDSLLKVGFLQEPKLSFHGEIICKMHDLVHDLTRQILQDELMSEIATTDQIKRCRYLSLTSFAGKVDTKIFDKVRILYIYSSDLVLVKTTKNWSCIRTIILEHVSATSLPLLVSKLENLRYLEISNVNCEALPEAISYCWNLQAIHLIDCRRLAVLPKSIGNLKKLRTLELKGSLNIRSLPQSIGGCDNLQNLHLYGCGLEEIPNSVANIEKLRVLTILRNNGLRQLPPLESFGKLSNLQAMALNNCRDLQHLPQWITLLSNLECLDLEYCEELVDLPESIGNLKMLKVLNLKGCRELCGLPAGCGQLTRLHEVGMFCCRR
jgi:type II secretory pathway predicted ATPase ExeA